MARLRVLSGSDVVAILKKFGFTEARQRGSHLAMQRRDGVATVTLTVVVPMHRELRTGTLLSIIRQSKLERALFEVEG